jgi:hypothetical protein
MTASPDVSVAMRRLQGCLEFELLRTDFPFLFPRPVRAPERSLAGVPLGGQYLVLGQRR